MPYRAVLSGLENGVVYQLTIKWDTTKDGTHALDYLTNWDRSFPATRNETNPDPLLGTSLVNPTVSYIGIPIDTRVADGQDGIANTLDDITQIAGQFAVFGSVGSLSFSDVYALTGLYSGNSSTSITLNFTYNGTTGGEAVVAWSGHIATRVDWGDSNSAVTIPGSPYHMALSSFTGGSASVGAQDRSLSADAVIYPGSITVEKQATPDGSTQTFNFEMTRPNNTVDVIAGGYIDLSGDGVIDSKDAGKFLDNDGEIYSITDGSNISKVSGIGDNKINGYTIINGQLDTSNNGTTGTEDKLTNLTGTGAISFTLTDGSSTTFNNLTDFSAYKVHEVVPNNWDLISINTEKVDQNNNTTTGLILNPSLDETTVTLAEANKWTLTFNNNLVAQPPAIQLEKTVSPVTLAEGSTGPVTYSYALTNTDPDPAVDSDPLTINELKDDNGTPANPADDFYLVQGGVVQPNVTLVRTGGDQDTLLEVGETWTYTTSRSILAQNANTAHTNTATVSAVDDEGAAASDTAHATVTYNNATPT
ncbi:MAG: hypothetical protein QX190_16510, partial [Methylococcales bacterium]